MEQNTIIINIDASDEKFYDKLLDEKDSDMARLKKCVAIVKNLRLVAAEIEVETAALYHAELWHDIEELKVMSEKMNTTP